MPEYVSRPGGSAAVENEEKVETPRRFQVLLHNDHYTTMEFVVEVLNRVFRKPEDEAVRIMLNVHQNGIGVAGVYVKSIAKTKAATVHKLAEDRGYPLKCSVEPE